MIWGWDLFRRFLLKGQHERTDGIERRSQERVDKANEAVARAIRLARQYKEMQQRGQLRRP